jgi:hypothetical protein
MKLRETIRPPERYASDAFYHAGANRGARRRSTNHPGPPIVEFDPNLPPAAFPTLSEPHSPGLEGLRIDENAPNIFDEVFAREREARFEASLHAFDHILPSHDEPQNTSSTSFNNFLASNGPQNPIYAENMRILASCTEATDTSMSDSDGDVEITPYNPSSPTKVCSYQINAASKRQFLSY